MARSGYPTNKTGATFTIPDTVTEISNNAFYKCTSLTSVDLPSSLKTIGEAAFDGCEAFTSVNIPGSVTEIGEDAFVRCYSLQTIVVDDSNINYSSENGILFDKAKTKLITYPAGKTDASYTIPDSVTNVGDYAFYNTPLTSVGISNSLTEIGGFLFYRCSSLTSVYIPSSVSSIGYLAL